MRGKLGQTKENLNYRAAASIPPSASSSRSRNSAESNEGYAEGRSKAPPKIKLRKSLAVLRPGRKYSPNVPSGIPEKILARE